MSQHQPFPMLTGASGALMNFAVTLAGAPVELAHQPVSFSPLPLHNECQDLCVCSPVQGGMLGHVTKVEGDEVHFAIGSMDALNAISRGASVAVVMSPEGLAVGLQLRET